MGRLTAGVAEALRVTFRREPLPPALDQPPPRRPGPGALARLLAPEPLPPDLPPAPPHGGRWLAWLLSPEHLDP